MHWLMNMVKDGTKKSVIARKKDILEDPLLERIAGLLKMPLDAIKNFDEEKSGPYHIQYIQ